MDSTPRVCKLLIALAWQSWEVANVVIRLGGIAVIRNSQTTGLVQAASVGTSEARAWRGCGIGTEAER